MGEDRILECGCLQVLRLPTLYTYSNISKCMGELLRMIILKPFHHCCLSTLNIFKQVRMRPFHEDNWEQRQSHRVRSVRYNRCSKTSMFIGQKITLLSAVWEGTSSWLKSSYLAKDLIFFNKYIAEKCSKTRKKNVWLTACFGERNS